MRTDKPPQELTTGRKKAGHGAFKCKRNKQNMLTKGGKKCNFKFLVASFNVSYTFLLIQLYISSLVLLLLFLLLVLQLFAQVVKLDTLTHCLSPHLKHTHTHTNLDLLPHNICLTPWHRNIKSVYASAVNMAKKALWTDMCQEAKNHLTHSDISSGLFVCKLLLLWIELQHVLGSLMARAVKPLPFVYEQQG